MLCKYAVALRLAFRTSTTRRFIYLGQHFIRGLPEEIELAAPVSIAGRKYLPSSESPGIPKFLSGPREDYPLLLKAQNGPSATLVQWAKRSRDVINEAYDKFNKDGSAVAILFRGLPIRNAEDFSEWVNNLGYDNVSSRQATGLLPEIAKNVASGSEEPKEYTIEPHNEQAYSSFHPKIFTICSFKKARYGGQTAIADAREVGRRLDPSFVGKCKRKNLRYWQYLPDKMSKHKSLVYKSWQRQFGMNDQTKVEDFLGSRGYSFKWEGKNLIMWKNLPPTTIHPFSGDHIWFNQMAANHCTYLKVMPLFEDIHLPNKEYPYHTTFGDGEEIGQDCIDEVRRAKWECLWV